MKRQIKMIICSIALLCGMLTSNRLVMAAPITSGNSAIIGIDSYEVAEGSLNPGEQVTLIIKLKNNSSVASAENIIMTYETEGNKLYPVYGEDNQVYIGNIEAGASKEIEISFMVAKDFLADMARMNMEFDYASAGTIVNNNVTLNIPSHVAGDLISDSIIVANNATVGVNSLVSIRCKNGGITDISDARLIVNGNVAEDSKEIELPIINAGKVCSEDYYVRFTESGIQTLQMEYRYTDNQGVTYTVDCGEYKVNVTNSVSEAENGTVVVEQVYSSSSIMIRIALLVVAVLAIVVTVVIYIRKRR